jgi:2-polyprenyl-6-methoxyphenol hydroxylase-like FAD-dependent oxidoreductase
MARVSNEDLYWYVSAPVDPQVDLALPPASLALRLTRSFHESVRAIVAATSADDLRMDLLVDRDPVMRWGEGAVTLLGDAAHPMLPHAGQGAAQALEDAVVLGRALAAGGPPEDALSHYEKERTRRTAEFVGLSRSNARMGSIHNAALCWLRDALIRTVPERWILKRLIALSRTPWS